MLTSYAPYLVQCCNYGQARVAYHATTFSKDGLALLFSGVSTAAVTITDLWRQRREHHFLKDIQVHEIEPVLDVTWYTLALPRLRHELTSLCASAREVWSWCSRNRHMLALTCVYTCMAAGYFAWTRRPSVPWAPKPKALVDVSTLDKAAYEAPFCAHCSIDLLEALEAPLAGREHAFCHCYVPTTCEFCTHLRAPMVQRQQFRRFTFRIEIEDYWVIISSTEGKRANEKRNQHSNVTNHFEGQQADEYTPRRCALQQLLRFIHASMTTKYYEGWLARPVILATHWRRVDGTSVVGSTTRDSRPNAVQEACDTQGGVAPTRVVVATSHPVDVPPTSPSEIREMERVVGLTPKGMEVRQAVDSQAIRVAPLLGNPVIYARNHALTAAAAVAPRMRQKNEKFRPTKELQDRMARYRNAALKHVFTAEAIKHAYTQMPLMETLKDSKLTEEQFLAKYEEVLFDSELPGRELFVKTEVTAKGEKPPRLIINEGLLRSVLNTVVCWIHQRIYFDHVLAMNIKHESKDQFADRLSGWFSSFPAGRGVGVEVDQTKFDLHQDYEVSRDGEKGLLQDEMEILEKIARHLPNGTFSASPIFRKVLEEYAAKETKLKYRPKKLDAKFKVMVQYMRWSGFDLTSGGNHYNELKATLCAFTKNPEKFWHIKPVTQPPSGGKVPPPDKDLVFTGLDGQPLLMKLGVEGDDVGGQTDRRVMDWMVEVDETYKDDNGQEQTRKKPKHEVEVNFALMGLDAKLKFIDGVRRKRLEFCGVHFLVDKNGNTKRGKWVPDVLRGLITSGASVTQAEDPITATVMRFMAKALLYARRCPPIATYYKSIAEAWVERAKIIQDAVHDFKDVRYAIGDIAQSVQSLRAAYDDEFSAAVSDNEARELLQCSVEAEINGQAYRKLLGGTGSVLPDTTPDEVYDFLPKCMTDRLRATFN